MKNTGIVGVGAALVDLLIEESDEYLRQIGGEKGGMTLVESSKISQYLQAAQNPPRLVPGGSACNTIVGISRLGGNASFIGARGPDPYGDDFQNGLKQAGVNGRLKISSGETGRVLSVVTPDAQRTMFTFLGASADLSANDIQPSSFAEAAIVHIEGYLLFNRDLTLHILETLRPPAKVSLDLASFQVVEAVRDFLKEILPKHVDIVLANEDEARAYTGKNEEDSLEELAAVCETAVVKKGKQGALIAGGNQRVSVDAHLVNAVDTTGAGDLWASGFLFGRSRGMDLEQSGNLGAVVASEVVQIFGAAIPEEGWGRIAEWRTSQGY